MGTENETDARLAMREDVKDNRWVVMDNRLAAGDDRLITRDNRLVVDNDGLAIEIGKRTDIDDGSDTQANNPADGGHGNRLDVDLIMIITGNIRTDLIKDFNNNISVVVFSNSSHIVSDKHAIDFSPQIFANVINNLFNNFSPLLIVLFSSLFLLSLPAPTTRNSGNISTTFIYYMLICIQDLIPSQQPSFVFTSFLLCLSQPLAIPVIFYNFHLLDVNLYTSFSANNIMPVFLESLSTRSAIIE